MSLASLYEIYRTLILATPQSFHHFILALIHLNETARPQNRVHGEILVADISVGEITVSELRQIRQRHHAPLLHHAPQVRGAVLIETRTHPDRHLHRRQP